MSTMDDTIAQIGQHLAKADRFKLVVLNAPFASGKSTKIVPGIWKTIKAREPKARGVYLVQRQRDAPFIAQRINSSATPATANFVGSELPSHEQLLVQQQIKLREIFPTPPEPDANTNELDLFVDVEAVRTSLGERTMNRVVETVQQELQLKDSPRSRKVSLVLVCVDLSAAYMGSLESIFGVKAFVGRCDVAVKVPITFAPGTTSVIEHGRKLLADFLRADDDRTNEKTPEVDEEGEVPEGLPGMCALLFAPEDEGSRLMLRPIMPSMQADAVAHWVTSDTTSDRLDMVARDPKRKIVCVDPLVGFPVYMPNVRLIVSFGRKHVRAYDPTSTQYLWTSVKLSKLELQRQSSYLPPSHGTTAAKEPEFVLLRDEQWYESLSALPDPTLGLEYPMLVTSTVEAFPSVALGEAPVPILHGPRNASSVRVWEATRRLLMTQALQPALPAGTYKITDIGRDMLRAWRTNFARPVDVHIAHMFARLAAAKKLPAEARRVVARLIAISICGISRLCLHTDKGTNTIRRGGINDILRLVDDYGGTGCQQYWNGSVWVALALWRGLVGRGLLTDSAAAPLQTVLDGNMQIDLEVARSVRVILAKIELLLGIPSLDAGVESSQTPLNSHELAAVNEILLWSYLHHVVLFPTDADITPRDMTSSQEVHIDTSRLVFDMKCRMDPKNTPGFCGFYQEMLLIGETIRPQDMTLIPMPAIRRISKDGKKRFEEMIQSPYAHEERTSSPFWVNYNTL